MSFAMEDSLESGWVSVRPNVFDEKEKHKFVFIVAWNDIEGKFAITCHNRTIQKRTAVRDSLVEAAESEFVSAKGEKKKPASDKQKSSLKSHSTDRTDICVPTMSGEIPVKGLNVTKRHITGKTVETRPVRSYTNGRLLPVDNTKVSDIEVIDPSTLIGDTRSPSDNAGGLEDLDSFLRQDFSWASLFSFQDMRTVHLQLCAVNSDLEPCLPPFPEEHSGMWTVLFGVPELTQRETEILCYQLQVYLGHALDTCGWKILSQVLFADGDSEEYYESLSELRQTGYEEALHRAKRRLHELLERQRSMESMVELLDLYAQQDEAYGDLVEATTELYHYLLQPFRDMRELAMLRRQQIKISLETEYLGPRRVEGLKHEDEDWQKKAHTAALSIQDLTVKYFETTARAQKLMYERMKVDQRKFGKAAWTAAVERMEKLQYAVSKETLQLMRAKEICLEQKKHGLCEEMQALQDGEDAMKHLDHLEALYYKLQLQLYEIQFEILKYEELLLSAQLQSLRRQMMERQDEVVYYDAYESPDAMQATDETASLGPPLRDEIAKLQQKTRQLEAIRGRITAKKAYLRNKKEICVINHNQKIQYRRNEVSGDSQHGLHQNEEEEEEELRNSRVRQERQKTLDRLRSFKQRYPGQVTLKSQRLRLAHNRKKCGAIQSMTSTEKQLHTQMMTQTQVASVQTDDCDTSMVPPEGSAGSLVRFSLPADGAKPVLSAPCSLQPNMATAFVLPSSPPPPPPPPPPFCDDIGSKGLTDAVSPKQHPSAASPSPHGSFSARFDSSQLLSARRKLRKTTSLESSQWRRASSPMDEVLASLKRGSFHLRKAELRVMAPDPNTDDGSNILAQIRKGVKLRKVPPHGGRSLPPDTCDPLTRSIHEALRRIKEASPESESEDEGPPCTDWES
ncbi:junction-mediating and -regulatory protein isoform X2 [Alosa pseudoharengus]|uniref:junction-mediating and -regulatory protein isoform X2 n=1 Tax=Alosa pseudoharengus TaxID=34774 RepID=UPI003F89179C